MKPAPFELIRARSVAEAVAALAGDDGAKVLAGGQSLVPLLALRLATPSVLVDITAAGLDGVAVEGPTLVLGAGVRHRVLERGAVVGSASPLLAEAAGLVGYPAIRNRGTIGGSLAHADPVAELPAALVALGGTVEATGPEGVRSIAAADLFEGFLTTTLAPDEVLTAVRVPVAAPGHGARFCEWAPRHGDFAVAGVGLTVDCDGGGVVVACRAAACGVASRPLDLSAVVAPFLVGGAGPGDLALRSLATATHAACVRAGADDDRGELTGLLAARAAWQAWGRAQGPAVAA